MVKDTAPWHMQTIFSFTLKQEYEALSIRLQPNKIYKLPSLNMTSAQHIEYFKLWTKELDDRTFKKTKSQLHSITKPYHSTESAFTSQNPVTNLMRIIA